MIRCSRSIRSISRSPIRRRATGLVATYDHDVTTHEWATGYRWDIVLTGSNRTPVEPEGTDH